MWDTENGDVETTLQCSRGKPVYCTASTAGQLLVVEWEGLRLQSAVLFALWWSRRSSLPVQLASDIYFDFLFEGDPASFSPDDKLVACVCRRVTCPA